MLLIEVNHLGPEAGSVLGRGIDLRRKGRGDQDARDGAAFDLGSMLGHLQRLWG